MPLYIANELLRQQLQPPESVVLLASKFNPGAEEVAVELKAMYPSVAYANDPARFPRSSSGMSFSIRSKEASMHNLAHLASEELSAARAGMRKLIRSASGHTLSGSATMSSQSMGTDEGSSTSKSKCLRGAVARQPTPTHFLLYLNFQTFVGEGGARLAEEVRVARKAKLPFVLAHENDPAKDGCQFER